MKPVVDGYIAVSLDETRYAMRVMAEKARVIAEGAGALSVAAALTGKAGQGPIVAIVSGAIGI
jgi:threonine dehydratase